MEGGGGTRKTATSAAKKAASSAARKRSTRQGSGTPRVPVDTRGLLQTVNQKDMSEMLAQLEALSPQEASPGAGNRQEEAGAQSTPRNLDANLRAADDNDVITMTRAEYIAKLAEVEATARAAAQYGVVKSCTDCARTSHHCIQC